MNILLTLIVLAAVGAFALKYYRSKQSQKNNGVDNPVNPADKERGLNNDSYN
jgi:hypothetical protein